MSNKDIKLQKQKKNQKYLKSNMAPVKVIDLDREKSIQSE